MRTRVGEKPVDRLRQSGEVLFDDYARTRLREFRGAWERGVSGA